MVVVEADNLEDEHANANPPADWKLCKCRVTWADSERLKKGKMIVCRIGSTARASLA